MAAIDFPASPTVGQIFAATNGVNYQWNGTLWLAVGPTSATSPGGDFTVVSAATQGIDTVLRVATPANVIIGNSGGWYNVNGRWTPPAGRYFLYGTATYASPGAVGTTFYIYLYKNGVFVPGASNATYRHEASATSSLAVEANVDANGTDYFELRISATQGATLNNCLFGAFPISGVKGPPGDPGQLGFRLLQRTAIGAAVPDVTITSIPADINDLKFTFDLTPVTNGVDLVMQFYLNGVLDSAAAHYASAVTAAIHTQATSSAPFVTGSSIVGITNALLLNYSVAARRPGNLTGIRGGGMVPNIKASRLHGADYQSNYVSDDGALIMVCTGGGYNNSGTAGALTGLRLVFGGGNIGSGAFSVWGSP